jgi:hypothetical protein
MPIATAVARVLFEGLSPRVAVRGLMERDPKAEAWNVAAAAPRRRTASASYWTVIESALLG